MKRGRKQTTRTLPRLVAIFIAPTKAEPPIEVPEARLVARCGVEGDRYFARAGTFWKAGKPDRQVTLIEQEALDAAARDYAVDLPPGAHRRNLVVEGVALNHLVGRRFRVGAAELEGLKLCEPCGHLAGLTHEDVRKALVHRGGLRARVVKGGAVRPGARVTL